MSGTEPTIESLNAELAELAREVRALSVAAERRVAARSANPPAPDGVVPAPDSAAPAPVPIRIDDTVAASFVATEGVIDHAGGWFTALSELGAIHNEQARMLFTDGLDTLRALRNAQSASQVVVTAFDHLSRRAAHVVAGLTRTIEVVARESRHASATVDEMWRPLADFVRIDAHRR